MNTNTSLPIAFIILILGISSCAKDSVHDSPDIKGEWTWVYSIGGDVYELYTPENTLKTEQLVIDNSRFKKYVNDSLVLDIDYVLNSIQTSTTTAEITVIKFSDGEQLVVDINATELTLTEQCIHCFFHQYRRN